MMYVRDREIEKLEGAQEVLRGAYEYRSGCQQLDAFLRTRVTLGDLHVF